MPTAVNPGWPVAGKRPAVIHRRAHGYAGRHLVVQQPADAPAQRRRQSRVQTFVAALRVGIDAAGEIAFEVREHRFGFVDIAHDDAQRRRAEGFGLQFLRLGKKLLSGHAQQRVRMARAAGTRPGAVRRSAPAPRSVFTLSASPLATPSDNNAGGCAASNAVFTSSMNWSVPRIGKKHHEAGVRAELSAAHQTARREVGGHLAAALGERAGQNHDGVDARHLEIDGLPYRIGGVLQRHAGCAAAGECAGAHAGSDTNR